MPLDYQTLLYDPNYSVFGVSCTMTFDDSEVIEGITALDKTTGIDVGDDGEGPRQQNILPVACVRVAEMNVNSIGADRLRGAKLTMNDEDWEVASYRRRPSPNGEVDGEYWLILTQWAIPNTAEQESE